MCPPPHPASCQKISRSLQTTAVLCCKFYRHRLRHRLNKIWYGTIVIPRRSQVSRGDPVGQGQTGEVWSRKICEEWDLPGKRRRWQLSTDKNGVGVWLNTFTWTWDESSHRSNYYQTINYNTQEIHIHTHSTHYSGYKEYIQTSYLVTKLQQHHVLVRSAISDDSDVFQTRSDK